MRNSLFNITALSLVISGALFADTTQAAPATTGAEASPFYQYHNRIAVFSPLHQTYERIKNNHLYVGVDNWIAYTGSSNKDGKHRDIGATELRFGYNYFWDGRCHFRPHAGVGAFKDFKKVHHNGEHDRRPSIVYGEVGFMYEHEFNTIFNLGFNAKGMFGGETSHGEDYATWGKTAYGFDVSLPITFRFGYHRRWDIRIEPFDLYMHGSKANINYYGFRNTIGYRF